MEQAGVEEVECREELQHRVSGAVGRFFRGLFGLKETQEEEHEEEKEKVLEKEEILEVLNILVGRLFTTIRRRRMTRW